MIELILRFLNARLGMLAMVSDIRTLCEQITDGDRSFPVQYLSKGEYKQVSDADFVQGLAYHRLTGAVTRSEIEGQSSGCAVQIRQTYPMRLICTARKSTFEQDNNFTDIKFAENIINALTSKNIKRLCRDLKADVVSIQIDNYNIDRKAVVASEYQGIDFQVDYEFVCLMVDYNIIIEAPSSCFNYWLCNDDFSTLNLCPPPDMVDGGNSADDDQFGEEVVPDLACDTACDDPDEIDGGDAGTQFNVTKGIFKPE